MVTLTEQGLKKGIQLGILKMAQALGPDGVTLHDLRPKCELFLRNLGGRPCRSSHAQGMTATPPQTPANLRATPPSLVSSVLLVVPSTVLRCIKG